MNFVQLQHEQRKAKLDELKRRRCFLAEQHFECLNELKTVNFCQSSTQNDDLVAPHTHQFQSHIDSFRNPHEAKRNNFEGKRSEMKLSRLFKQCNLNSNL